MEGEEVMGVAHIYVTLSYDASRDSVYDTPSRSGLWAALDAYNLEEKTRRMFEWKEPKKRIPVPTVPVIRRYDKMFTGRNFPIGGPKK